MNLFRLLSGLDRKVFINHVVSLLPTGQIGILIQSLGIEVDHLNFRRGIPNPFLLVKLIKTYRKFAPCIIHCWMHHSNFIGALLGITNRGTSIVWDVHHSATALSSDKLLTRAITFSCGTLSWIDSATSSIVLRGPATKKNYIDYGYNPSKMNVIPNGFDMDVFCPDRNGGQKIKSEFGFSPDLHLIGIIARFHPDKDILTFLQAANLAIKKREDLRFIMAGEGLDDNNSSLKELIRDYGLARFTKLLGVRNDIPAVMNSLDLLTLTSVTECFPNVIGEAMACAIPCVATDVGDTSHIIGDAGKTVQVKQPEKIAEAWLDIISLDRKQKIVLGEKALRRIRDNFQLHQMVHSYQEIYNSVLTERRKSLGQKCMPEFLDEK